MNRGLGGIPFTDEENDLDLFCQLEKVLQNEDPSYIDPTIDYSRLYSEFPDTFKDFQRKQNTPAISTTNSKTKSLTTPEPPEEEEDYHNEAQKIQEMYETMTQQMETMKQQKVDLEKERASIQQEKKALAKQKARIESDQVLSRAVDPSVLKTKYKKLKKAYQSEKNLWESERNSFESEKNLWESEKNSWETEKHSFETAKNAWETEKNSWESERELLLSQIQDLTQKLSEAEERISSLEDEIKEAHSKEAKTTFPQILSDPISRSSKEKSVSDQFENESENVTKLPPFASNENSERENDVDEDLDNSASSDDGNGHEKTFCTLPDPDLFAIGYRLDFDYNPGAILREEDKVDGRKLLRFRDGTRGVVFKNGTVRYKRIEDTIIKYDNGDVAIEFKDGTRAYRYEETAAIEVTLPDNSTILSFPNGQKEKHFSNGDKAVLFPNNQFKMTYANGDYEICHPSGKIERSIAGKFSTTSMKN